MTKIILLVLIGCYNFILNNQNIDTYYSFFICQKFSIVIANHIRFGHHPNQFDLLLFITTASLTHSKAKRIKRKKEIF